MDLENKNLDNKELLEKRNLHTCIKCGKQYNEGEECQHCKNVEKDNLKKGVATITENLKNKINLGKGKNIKILFLSIVFVLFLIGITIFFIVKIPFKYCGTYISYSYYNGTKTKHIYKISPLSIKYIIEYNDNGDFEIEKEKLKYYKKGRDIIVKSSYSENYMIIEDECLYLETSKDISIAKKYKDYYWNINSDKADLYEIENKAEGFENIIETVTNNWSRKVIYDISEKELGSSNFYILSSEEETDTTDLKRYEVKFKAAGGELSLYYDRETKEIERIFFWGSIKNDYSYANDSMDVEDIYDCRAMLLAIMYILGNKNEEELSENLHNLNTSEDYNSRISALIDYRDLIGNNVIDKNDENKNSYSLKNDKYDISLNSMFTSSVYYSYGYMYFDIYIN